MRTLFLIGLALLHLDCTYTSSANVNRPDVILKLTKQPLAKDTWQHFLRHLPISNGPVIDYKGNVVDIHEKHVAIVEYDVGTKDLQQCADALMRLRAEYLFATKRSKEIGFHFTSGHYFSYTKYLQGYAPIVSGSNVDFRLTTAKQNIHTSLRNYLDIIYAYAGTISLHKELKEATDFSIGTVIISPGSPGHCCIVVDEVVSANGKRLYKLVEGYTPAQTIYVLSNPYGDESPWYALEKGKPIYTASYSFKSYYLKKFE